MSDMHIHRNAEAATCGERPITIEAVFPIRDEGGWTAISQLPVECLTLSRSEKRRRAMSRYSSFYTFKKTISYNCSHPYMLWPVTIAVTEISAPCPVLAGC